LFCNNSLYYSHILPLFNYCVIYLTPYLGLVVAPTLYLLIG